MNYNVSKNHDYCYLEIPNEENKILKYNHGEKSIKVPFVITCNDKSLLERSKLFTSVYLKE